MGPGRRPRARRPPRRPPVVVLVDAPPIGGAPLVGSGVERHAGPLALADEGAARRRAPRPHATGLAGGAPAPRGEPGARARAGRHLDGRVGAPSAGAGGVLRRRRRGGACAGRAERGRRARRGDDWLIAWAIHLLALAAHIAADYPSARAHY